MGHNRILFITTKNLDYIRNVQEIRLIKERASHVTVIGSVHKSYIIRLLEVYRKLLLTDISGYDEVFVGFAPQLILPMWKRKFRNKTVVIDFFISLYDTFVNDRKVFSEQSFWAKVLKWLDTAAIKCADRIIVDTNAHGDYFSEEFGAEKEKRITLYLEADQTIYYPRKVEKPPRLKDKFVVLYFGSVLPLQGVDVVLEAYRLLKNEERFHFYMIGDVGAKYQKPQSDQIEYIQWLPQEKLAEYIAMADLCLAGHFNKDIEKAHRTIPGKAYIYQAMEKNMILGDSRANHELFEASDQVYFVPMGDAQALAACITELADKWNHGKRD